MKTDYPELEGKEITWERDDMSFRALVVGVNYHIGITLVEAEYNDMELTCLNRKVAIEEFGMSKSDYRKRFQDTVKRIKTGYYNVNDHHEAIGFEPGFGGSTLQCAFK